MQANWSLILNVLLLIGVVVSIGRLMKTRRQSFTEPPVSQPTLGRVENKFLDDIIAVRKISQDFAVEDMVDNEPALNVIAATSPSLNTEIEPFEEVQQSEEFEEVEEVEEVEEIRPEAQHGKKNESGKSIMMFLLAKENRALAGYELLQTVLAAGLRFGDGHLFHRHQHSNGQGPVICSLAAATATGVFDLQNIGAFSVRGLCLFMQSSGNPSIDSERFDIMLETANQLSEDLDTYLLDEQQRPLNKEAIARYCRLLNIKNSAVFNERFETA